ncbi:unnamed protein product [Mesocestoides corti]|uniref:Homeobox domain-containing protein n=1 Tax=Mesocestoides corti TaxID=53468 RepID=A0A0R3UJS1_MESCO|nr:unnamed protein product [Mesocestoides corti]
MCVQTVRLFYCAIRYLTGHTQTLLETGGEPAASKPPGPQRQASFLHLRSRTQQVLIGYASTVFAALLREAFSIFNLELPSTAGISGMDFWDHSNKGMASTSTSSTWKVAASKPGLEEPKKCEIAPCRSQSCFQISENSNQVFDESGMHTSWNASQGYLQNPSFLDDYVYKTSQQSYVGLSASALYQPTGDFGAVVAWRPPDSPAPAPLRCYERYSGGCISEEYNSTPPTVFNQQSQQQQHPQMALHWTE